jgi:carbonic anhydrase/acetyltransferase-like protein (isoleucine patch superfamily)
MSPTTEIEHFLEEIDSLCKLTKEGIRDTLVVGERLVRYGVACASASLPEYDTDDTLLSGISTMGLGGLKVFPPRSAIPPNIVFDQNTTVIVGHSSKIGSNVSFHGKVVVGSNTYIGASTVFSETSNGAILDGGVLASGIKLLGDINVAGCSLLGIDIEVSHRVSFQPPIQLSPKHPTYVNPSIRFLEGGRHFKADERVVMILQYPPNLPLDVSAFVRSLHLDTNLFDSPLSSGKFKLLEGNVISIFFPHVPFIVTHVGIEEAGEDIVSRSLWKTEITGLQGIPSKAINGEFQEVFPCSSQGGDLPMYQWSRVEIIDGRVEDQPETKEFFRKQAIDLITTSKNGAQREWREQRLSVIKTDLLAATSQMGVEAKSLLGVLRYVSHTLEKMGGLKYLSYEALLTRVVRGRLLSYCMKRGGVGLQGVTIEVPGNSDRYPVGRYTGAFFGNLNVIETKSSDRTSLPILSKFGDTTMIRGAVSIGAGSVIGDYSIITGGLDFPASLGKGVVVGKHCSLKNTLIGDGVQIGGGTDLSYEGNLQFSTPILQGRVSLGNDPNVTFNGKSVEPTPKGTSLVQMIIPSSPPRKDRFPLVWYAFMNGDALHITGVEGDAVIHHDGKLDSEKLKSDDPLLRHAVSVALPCFLDPPSKQLVFQNTSGTTK